MSIQNGIFELVYLRDMRWLSELGKIHHREKEARSFEQKNEEQGISLWGWYDRDVKTYLPGFAQFFPELNQLKSDITRRKKQGEYVAVVDLFGAASAGSVGADKSIGTTLKKWDSVDEKQTQTIVEGNLLKEKGLQSLLDEIEKLPDGVTYVFFRPIAGVSGLEGNSLANLRLYKIMEELFKHLAVSGAMYLDLQDLRGAQLLNKIFSTSDGVEFEIRTDEYGNVPRARLRKTKAGARLPSMESIARNPEMHQEFIELAEKSDFGWKEDQVRKPPSGGWPR